MQGSICILLESIVGTKLQLASIISSIAFIVLVGIEFIVILTVPGLSQNPAYPMIWAVVISAIVTPIVGWFIASKIIKAQ
ncbi:hypothetical protein ACFOLL_06690 [Falsochrobactrum ovis]|uniref:Uncharacterized protein n=1 Tax=Falsochrobactrum ovis TaxID=1293442 RepID=A0A364JZI8_9HYPH|nr:hypothetical protein [Falsochrobactrum ovis]RAK34128.1 hypothetical protein C7374_101460 [Falsochrobactrum ovis]